jgi:hypothetical protein
MAAWGIPRERRPPGIFGVPVSGILKGQWKLRYIIKIEKGNNIFSY